MTRFKNILKRTNRPDEHLYLMELTLGAKDELGFPKEGYEEVQEFRGIIQEPQFLDIDFSGQESHPIYTAYLMPDFNLKAEILNNYRIKYERPYETLILKIVQYDPNLFLRHKRHHVEIHLELEKKYEAKN